MIAVIAIMVIEQSWSYGVLFLLGGYLAEPCITIPQRYAAGQITEKRMRVEKISTVRFKGKKQLVLREETGRMPTQEDYLVTMLPLSKKEASFLEAGLVLCVYIDLRSPSRLLAWAIVGAIEAS